MKRKSYDSQQNNLVDDTSSAVNTGSITLAVILIGFAMLTHTLPIVAVIGVVLGFLHVCNLMVNANSKTAVSASNQAKSRRGFFSTFFRL